MDKLCHDKTTHILFAKQGKCKKNQQKKINPVQNHFVLEKFNRINRTRFDKSPDQEKTLWESFTKRKSVGWGYDTIFMFIKCQQFNTFTEKMYSTINSDCIGY